MTSNGSCPPLIGSTVRHQISSFYHSILLLTFPSRPTSWYVRSTVVCSFTTRPAKVHCFRCNAERSISYSQTVTPAPVRRQHCARSRFAARSSPPQNLWRACPSVAALHSRYAFSPQFRMWSARPLLRNPYLFCGSCLTICTN